MGHGNPYGGTAGFIDRSEPGWEDRVNEMVKNRTGRKKSGDGRGRGFQTNFRVTANFKALLHQAAQSRDMAVGAYVRRAVAAFVSKDTGTPMAEILKGLPAPQGFGQSHFQRATNKAQAPDDDGTGFGTWAVL